jgi:hypothetical protein
MLDFIEYVRAYGGASIGHMDTVVSNMGCHV